MNQKKNAMIGMGAVLIVAIIVIAIIGKIIAAINNKINLNDYLTIRFNGYDTYGTASFDFDTEQLVEDYKDLLEIESENEMLRKMMVLETYVSAKLDKTEYLKNGDSVKLEWKVDEKKLEENLGCKIKYSDIKEKVKTLEELTKYDPFDDLVVVFEGVSPNASVRIDTSKLKYSFLSFKADTTTGLEVGDKVTVSISDESTMEYYCASEGVKITKTEKEYTIDKLPSLIKKLSEIPDKELDKMKSESEDAMFAYIAQHWAETESCKGMEFIGNYLLVAKDGSKNYLYNVYRIDISNSSADLSYYWYTSFDTLMLLDDGTFTVDYSDYYTPNANRSESFVNGDYRYYGYEHLDSLFNVCVTRNIDNYTYESSVKE